MVKAITPRYRYDQLMRLKLALTAMEPASAGVDNSVYSNNIWEASTASTADYRVSLSYDKNGNINSLLRNAYTDPNPAPLMDALTYNYAGVNSIGKVHNQLNHVDDAIATSLYGVDIADQNSNNYTYDRIGNLIADVSEEIANIEWNVQGKVKQLIRTAGSTRPDLEYRYDSQGNRIEKIIKTKTSAGVLQPQYFWQSTHYVRDAEGNTLATYDKKYDRYSVNNGVVIPTITQFENDLYLIREGSGASVPTDPTGVPELTLTDGLVPIGGTGNEYVEVFTWEEAHLFGSNRLGLESKNQVVSIADFTASVNSSDGSFQSFANQGSFDLHKIETYYQRRLGDKKYELSNHLGNVLVVITDRPIAVSTDGTTVSHYGADVLRSTDYYPFGMEMVGRTSGADNYRYGFNGKEDNREWGNQLIQDYGFRLYNPAIGKFLSVDPLAPDYPWYTPYQFAGNGPITNVDLDGLEPKASTENRNRVEGILTNKIGNGYLLDATTGSFNSSPDTWWRRAQNLSKNSGNREYFKLIGITGEALAAQIIDNSWLALTVADFPGARAPVHVIGAHFNILGDTDDEGGNGLPIVDMIGGTYDYAIKLKRNRLRLLFKPNVSGLVISAYDQTGVFETDVHTYSLNSFAINRSFLYEVKTLNPKNTSSNSYNIIKGLNQAIKNARLNKGRKAVSVLVVDKEAYVNAYENAGPGTKKRIERLHRKLTRKYDGFLYLIPDLYSRSVNITDETIREIRTTTDKKQKTD